MRSVIWGSKGIFMGLRSHREPQGVAKNSEIEPAWVSFADWFASRRGHKYTW